MLNSQLQKILITTIRAGLTAYPGTPPLPDGIIIQPAYQPRQQGVPIPPTITYYDKGTVPRGFPKFENFTDPDTNVFMRRERQRQETTYQIGALVLQDPTTPDQMTETDVLNIVRSILQGQQALSILNPMDIGVLRVSQISSNFFIDDRGQNENNPIFDIILTYMQENVFPADAIQQDVISAGIYPILGS